LIERLMTFDLIVFGATSFVGKLVCRYLLEHYGNGAREGALQWAVAARSQTKLAELKTELESEGLVVKGLRQVLADASDEATLEAMCQQTRVVISTVGPYALYGETLVKVCAQSGTDYCDLTGEPQWIHDMIARYQVAARASGARIVHCCGFDSIPSDLGVWHLQQVALQRFGEPCTRVRMRVKAMKGGASGGTVASLVNVVKEASHNAELRKQLRDPYSLCGSGYAPKLKLPEVRFAAFDEDFKTWVGPFVMAAINTRVVLRSHALMAPRYGESFIYDEAMMTGKGTLGRLAAAGLSVGLAGFVMGVALPPARWALEKFVLPAPGQGPSPEAQKKGSFDLRFAGHTANGQLLMSKVTGDRDPGYGSTAKMLSEAAICLANDRDKRMPFASQSGTTNKSNNEASSSKPAPWKQHSGGFWTPASLFGDALIERLESKAGVLFEILEPNQTS
jgi:short subunit dehydrogenase-like uncharacterized protein